MASEIEKMRARAAVKRALTSGRLTRPRTCEQCGSEPPPASDGRSTLHAHHHHGYELPLDVIWLCPVCHFSHDRRPAGEKNGMAQLTQDQVVDIRSRYRPDAKWWSPDGGAKTLAREFGVSARTIGRIVRGEIWIDASLNEGEAQR